MKSDILIVGGGILGASYALAALKKGLSVVLLEKDLTPTESTVRNFGQVVPSGMARGEWFEYGRRSLAIYNELQNQYDVGLRNNGSNYIASSPDEMAVNEELYQYYQSINYSCELWTKEETCAKYPSLQKDYVYGALFFPEEFSAEPEILIHRLHDYMRKKYSNYTYLPYHTVVDSYAKRDYCYTNTATKKEFISEHVIICSGRDFKILFPEHFKNSELVVSKLNMCSTYPLPEIKLPGNILTGLTIRRYEAFEACNAYQKLDNTKVKKELRDFGIHILFKQRLDGSIIIGDSHEYESYDQADKLNFYVNNYITNLMLEEARKIIQLPDWKIQMHWTGFYSQCKDKEIFHKVIDERIHIITGIGGKGMTTSMGFAEHSLKTITNPNHVF